MCACLFRILVNQPHFFHLRGKKKIKNTEFFTHKIVIILINRPLFIITWYCQVAQTQTQASSGRRIKSEFLWGWAVRQREVGASRRAVKTVWHLGPISQWQHLLHQGCKLHLHWTLRRGKRKHRVMPDCTERPSAACILCMLQRIPSWKVAALTSWPSSICCHKQAFHF